jgi:hypothetical protein
MYIFKYLCLYLNTYIGMTSNHPEVLNVLLELTKHVESVEKFKAQHLGNSLYGLQGEHNTHYV